MKIIITICSRDKDKRQALMPADERYLSKRIKLVKEIAEKEQQPFFILSGKFGLIPSETSIPWYDQKLKSELVDSLIPFLLWQIKNYKVSEIVFYGKDKHTEGWTAYHEAIERVTKEMNISLEKRLLENV